MSDRDPIKTYNAKTPTGTAGQLEEFIANGAQSVPVEKYQAVWTTIILALGFGAAIFEVLLQTHVPYADPIMGIAIVSGTIEIGRLERVNVFTRLIMLTALSGTSLLFVKAVMGSQFMTVLIGAVGVLFVNTLINLYAQQQTSGQGQGMPAADVKRHGLYFGWFLGVSAGLGVLMWLVGAL